MYILLIKAQLFSNMCSVYPMNPNANSITFIIMYAKVKNVHYLKGLPDISQHQREGGGE